MELTQTWALTSTRLRGEMTNTLFDITYEIARELKITREGVATGGSTASIIDATNRTEDDDFWNGGTAWVVKDAGGANAAPQGEYAKVTDFVKSTGTLSFATGAFTAAVAAGDIYVVGKKRYPIDIIVQQVNAALRENVKVPTADATSLTTISNQREYTLPAAAQIKLLQVFIQTNDDDSDDNGWTTVRDWEVTAGATGSADTLVFSEQFDGGYKIKLVYLAPHPELHIYSDKLSERVPIQRLIYNATARCLNWYNTKIGGGDQALLADIARYESLALKKEQEEPNVIRPRRSPRYLRVQ